MPGECPDEAVVESVARHAKPKPPRPPPLLDRVSFFGKTANNDGLTPPWVITRSCAGEVLAEQCEPIIAGDYPGGHAAYLEHLRAARSHPVLPLCPRVRSFPAKTNPETACNTQPPPPNEGFPRASPPDAGACPDSCPSSIVDRADLETALSTVRCRRRYAEASSRGSPCTKVWMAGSVAYRQGRSRAVYEGDGAASRLQRRVPSRRRDSTTPSSSVPPRD